jgi:hypothetical protein
MTGEIALEVVTANPDSGLSVAELDGRKVAGRDPAAHAGRGDAEDERHLADVEKLLVCTHGYLSFSHEHTFV